MGKIKINKRDNYTIISNHVIKNQNLSLKAKGLFVFMWSQSDNWDYSVAGLVKVLKEGKDAINEALKELEKEGYLVRTILRKGGKFADMDYILHELPQKVPFTENPQAEKPLTENPQQINTNINKGIKEKNTLPTEEERAPEIKTYTNYGEIYTDPLNSEIRVALEKFIKSLKDKHGYTPKVVTVVNFADTLRKLSSNNSELAMRIVDQSINNNWKALYKLKDRHNRDAVSTPFNPEKDTLAKDTNGKALVY